MENKITALQGQTLIDLTLQTTGSIEGLFEFAAANGRSITDLPVPGEVLKQVQHDKNENRQIMNYYRAHDIRPVTRLEMGPESETLFEEGLYEEKLFE